MATAGSWHSLGGVSLASEVVSALEACGFASMTPVQAAAIPPLLSAKDVAVDAETGSGKTLSFLVPIAQMLLFDRRSACFHPSPTIRGLVIVPTRELAVQVHAVARTLFARLPGGVRPVPLIGGEVGIGAQPGPSAEFAGDMRLVVATPGRLNAALDADAVSVKRLEILVMDEADRLLDMGFAVALTSILTRLPKQRRTGLYSATQTQQVEELARAGLRNPVRVAVRVRQRSSASVDDDAISAPSAGCKPNGRITSSRRAVPVSLTCYFALVPHEHKLHHLIRLLTSQPTKKFIVYMLTCACVDFMARLPWQELFKLEMTQAGSEERCTKDLLPHPTSLRGGLSNLDIIPLHGKMAQSKRSRALASFAARNNAVLICTDVAARGLDIPDVDWIVQYDPPQDPDAYVHRVGRTARLGREGNSIIYLAPQEDAYADFLTVRKCPVESFQWSSQGKPSASACEDIDDSDSKCNIRDKTDGDNTESGKFCAAGSATCAACDRAVRQAILADRAILDASEKAFLSYLRAYKEHRCTYLLPFGKLEISSVARSFHLLRLPRFQEFRKYRAKLDFKGDQSVRIRDIAYKDNARERARQNQICHALKHHRERRDTIKARSKLTAKERKRNAKRLRAARYERARDGDGERGSRADESSDEDANAEMDEEARLIKKVRTGKLSRVQFDTAAGYVDDE